MCRSIVFYWFLKNLITPEMRRYSYSFSRVKYFFDKFRFWPHGRMNNTVCVEVGIRIVFSHIIIVWILQRVQSFYSVRYTTALRLWQTIFTFRKCILYIIHVLYYRDFRRANNPSFTSVLCPADVLKSVYVRVFFVFCRCQETCFSEVEFYENRVRRERNAYYCIVSLTAYSFGIRPNEIYLWLRCIVACKQIRLRG